MWNSNKQNFWTFHYYLQIKMFDVPVTVLKWKIIVYVVPSQPLYLVTVHSSVMTSPPSICTWTTEVMWNGKGLRTQGWTCHIYVNISLLSPTFVCVACEQVIDSVVNVKRTCRAVNTMPQGQNSKRKRPHDTWNMSKNNGNLNKCLQASCPEG